VSFGRYALLGALVAAASIGLAGPAGADWTDGNYTYTDTDTDTSTPGRFLGTWVVSSCGTGCKHVEVPETGGSLEFHQTGNSWSRTEIEPGCTFTVDNNSLTAMSTCMGVSLQRQLAKNG